MCIGYIRDLVSKPALNVSGVDELFALLNHFMKYMH